MHTETTAALPFIASAAVMYAVYVCDPRFAPGKSK